MSAFVPFTHDVPSYLLPMMNDTDRNTTYEAAIKETIEKFKKEQQRSPNVLDVGAGAGMLSLICLEHGAAHVTMIEANKTLVNLARSEMQRSGHPTSKWTIINCMSTQFTLKPNQQPFDMIVSELIGTVLQSESMSVYLWDLLKRGVIQTFINGDNNHTVRYMVPQKGEMTARICRCPHAVGLDTSLPYASMQSIYNAVYDTRRVSSRAEWTCDESMKFCFASGPWEAISESIPVLREQYDTETDSIQYEEEMFCNLLPNVPIDAVLILEWKVQLSPTQILYHTLEHVAKLPTQVRLARWVNWGFVFAPLHHFVDETSLSRGVCHMRMKWHPHDFEVGAVPAPSNPLTDVQKIKKKWVVVSSKKLNRIINETNSIVVRGK
jgi:predicted RNA methylase